MSNQLSVLRFVDTPEDIAVPVVDGVPLYETFPDRYPGLIVSLVLPPSRQWLDAPTYQEDGRAVILDGGCTIAECCGVMARITLEQDTVVWSDFFARGLPRIRHDLRFEFDRADYDLALAGLAAASRIEWDGRIGELD
jgi:hypothetical protein